MSAASHTLIARWRELAGLTRPQAADLAETSLPRWLRFEREQLDYLASPRPLFGTVGAPVLVLPPAAATLDLEDQVRLGPSRYRAMLELVESIDSSTHPNLGGTALRQSLARALVGLALRVAAPRAQTTAEQAAALSKALRTGRYTLGFETTD